MNQDRKPFTDEAIHVSLVHLCKDSSCPSWKRCYRFRAIPNAESIYFSESPRLLQHSKSKCTYFMSFHSAMPVLSETQLNGL